MITTGGEGKIQARKHMRGKIGNPTKAFELKGHNMLVDGTDTEDNAWTDKTNFGVFTNSNNGVWFPVYLNWPAQGVTAHNRIGDNIRVRFLRIKGYVAYSPYLITQVRYRIVLYRAKKWTNINFTQWLKPMYYKIADMPGDNTIQTADRCIFNYYCAFFRPEFLKEHDIKRRVLLKGVINPQQDIGNFKSGGTTWTGEFQYHVTTHGTANNDSPCNQRGFFPIDISVNMNDNVDCAVYDYIMVFETDWCVGQTPSGTFASDTDHSNFYFCWIPQLYFTDD